MEEVKAFTFYRNYYEIIKYLPMKDKVQLYDAILEYMFEDKEPELKELLKGIWVNLKMPLDSNKKNIKNGQKGGRPKKENDDLIEEIENPKKTQTITQKKPKVEPKPKANNISYFLFLISNNNYKYININNNIYNKIIEWLEYKQERKELYKETGLKNLLTQIENNIDQYGEEKVIDVISQSMANNWKGIIFDKLTSKEQPTYMSYKERKKLEEEKMWEEFLKGDNNG